MSEPRGRGLGGDEPLVPHPWEGCPRGRADLRPGPHPLRPCRPRGGPAPRPSAAGLRPRKRVTSDTNASCWGQTHPRIPGRSGISHNPQPRERIFKGAGGGHQPARPSGARAAWTPPLHRRRRRRPAGGRKGNGGAQTRGARGRGRRPTNPARSGRGEPGALTRGGGASQRNPPRLSPHDLAQTRGAAGRRGRGSRAEA